MTRNHGHPDRGPLVGDRGPSNLTVDVVLLSVDGDSLRVLLRERARQPFAGMLALPGGFVGNDEPFEAAVSRVLAERAGLDHVFVEQLFTFGRLDRDPRDRVVSVAYYALVSPTRPANVPTPNVRWWRVLQQVLDDGSPLVGVVDDVGGHQPLGFDHGEILATAVQRLRDEIDQPAVAAQLLPAEFTLLQLQRVHEAVLGRRLNKDWFRRRARRQPQLQATGRYETGVDHRPAELYRFKRQ